LLIVSFNIKAMVNTVFPRPYERTMSKFFARKSYIRYECDALTWSSARIPPEQYKLEVSFWTIHDRAILWKKQPL